MGCYLNFRTGNVGGAVVSPFVLTGDGAAAEPAMTLVDWSAVPALVYGKDLLFVAHGFNVSYSDGLTSLGLLEQYLNLPEPALVIGVLWPGDCWLPVIDYPVEGNVAVQCGRLLATFCKRWCKNASSLSFASHSLGARLILEAVSELAPLRARSVCLTAGAINRDCLVAEYRVAVDNADHIAVLASRKDDVLKFAFSVGDPFADVLLDDHTPFRAALGSIGPPAGAGNVVPAPWQIPEAPPYGHGNYLPVRDPLNRLWQQPAEFIRRSFYARTQTWP